VAPDHRLAVRRRPALRVSLFSLLILPLIGPGLFAHEIPNDVTVQAWVRPGGEVLEVLVRVPLESMQDIDWPTRGTGYLEIARAEPMLTDAARVWLVNDLELYEGDVRLPVPEITATRLSFPSDDSFRTWDGAIAHVQGPPMDASTDIVWQQLLLDVVLEYPIESPDSEFSIRPALDRLGLTVLTVVRFVRPDGVIRPFEFLGDPGRVPLDPLWFQAAFRFVALGFFHILDGLDHLLFLLCLVIPFRKIRPLVLVVTAFTLGHSITLIGSALDIAPGGLWFPPLVETLIAMSIVYMALENIVGARVEWRWIVTLGFGLVHGFGFSFALGETLQFAGAHLLTSLVAFNIGVELGQLLVLAVMVPVLSILFRRGVDERVGTVILSAILAHTAWHWMIERFEILRQYTFPSLDPEVFGRVLQVLTVLAFGAGLVWLAVALRKKPDRREVGS